MTSNANGLLRPNYFDRQQLTAADLMAGITYLRARLRRHNRYLHGWGVVCGARVSQEDSQKDSWVVSVGEGYVITPQGDEVYIPPGITFNICAGVEACAPELLDRCPDAENLKAPAETTGGIHCVDFEEFEPGAQVGSPMTKGGLTFAIAGTDLISVGAVGPSERGLVIYRRMVIGLPAPAAPVTLMLYGPTTGAFRLEAYDATGTPIESQLVTVSEGASRTITLNGPDITHISVESEVPGILLQVCRPMADESEPVLESVEVYLAVCPHEKDACSQPAVPTECQPPGGEYAWSRIRETFQLQVVCELPPSHQISPHDCEDLAAYVCDEAKPVPCLPQFEDGDNGVVLASIKVGQAGTSFQIDNWSDRRRILSHELQLAYLRCKCGEAPTISGINPASGRQGTQVDAVITGQGLAGVTTAIFSGSGVTADVLSNVTDTEVQVRITIAPNALPGEHSFTVTTPAGTAQSPPGVVFVVREAERLIKAVEAVDDFTVEITLNRPAFDFPALLTNLGPYALVSPKALEELGEGIAEHPVGTGPFFFQAWEPGSHIVLTRNDAYWGQRPSFQVLIFRFVHEAGTLISMLVAGNIHMFDTRNEQLAETAGEMGMNVKRVESFYKDNGVFLISRPEIGGDFVSPGGLHLEFVQNVEQPRYGSLEKPSTFDPLQMQDTASLKIATQVLDGLTGYQPGVDEVLPHLAESWGSNEKGDVWHFKLRQGITFHDGTAFTAEAVVANFERHLA